MALNSHIDVKISNKIDISEQIRKLSDDQNLLWSKCGYPSILKKAAKGKLLINDHGEENRITPHPVFDLLLSEEVWRVFRTYESKWQSITSSDEVSGILWKFSDVPWPLLEPPKSLADFPADSMKFWDFLLDERRLREVRADDMIPYIHEERSRLWGNEDTRAKLLARVRDCDRTDVKTAINCCWELICYAPDEANANLRHLYKIKKEMENRVRGADEEFGIPCFVASPQSCVE